MRCAAKTSEMAKTAGAKGSMRLTKKVQEGRNNGKDGNKKSATAVEVSQDESASEEESQSEASDQESDDAEGVKLSEASEDEVNVDESDAVEDSGSEESSGDDMPKKKRKTGDGSQEFASAFNAIIGSKLKAHKRDDPIMARSKTVQKQLDSAKLEAKAKKQLLAEKKTLHDSHRVKNLLPGADEPEKVRDALESEKALKKVAQRGVVRLFNAVLSTQVKSAQQVAGDKMGVVRKEELLNEVSKEQFLDLVQAAGNV